ncbi:MAG: hypothetical protein M0R77_01095 [Gammaproteobacteria bacterium]|nr:hypothetical protein [Acholeplasmataceae bacterium]MCK9529152.1 hypothetical protein [Gammaproteobacteria bacterium]
MSTKIIDLINATDPADFLGRAKEALPNRIFPSQESLETQSFFSQIFMDSIKKEAFLSFLKSLRSKDISTTSNIKNNIAEIKKNISKLKAYREKNAFSLMDYEDIVIPLEYLQTVFAPVSRYPLIDVVTNTLCVIESISSLFSREAVRGKEDGKFYPVNCDDVTTYLPVKQLIEPVGIEKWKEVGIDTVALEDAFCKYIAIWTSNSDVNLTIAEKVIDDLEDLPVISTSDWSDLDTLLRDSELTDKLDALLAQLEEYLQSNFDWMDVVTNVLNSTDEQSSLVNLVRITDSLYQNWRNLHYSFEGLSTLLSCFITALVYCTEQFKKPV